MQLIIRRRFESAMLEQQTIILTQPRTTRRWSIVHGDNRASLGWADWKGSLWWGLALEIRELEDEPIVFSIHRSWSLIPKRLVYDAEGRFIGAIAGSRIENAKGKLLAHRAWHKDRRYSAFMSRRGEEIAEVAPENQGALLTFNDGLRDQPFVKMLLMSSVFCTRRFGWF